MTVAGAGSNVSCQDFCCLALPLLAQTQLPGYSAAIQRRRAIALLLLARPPHAIRSALRCICCHPSGCRLTNEVELATNDFGRCPHPFSVDL